MLKAIKLRFLFAEGLVVVNYRECKERKEKKTEFYYSSGYLRIAVTTMLPRIIERKRKRAGIGIYYSRCAPYCGICKLIYNGILLWTNV
ncbi:hypothetical protein KPH14_005119 [Odynerus spinipes]|uniref:Uncharacterized protein n=1 Tax=Odynerus spinipes TaxID=1348599 RepID=A0AAD9RKH4_9HYME|nr:hypothetical protein KPH14_005119 [Odynerus spinipes]